MSLIIKDPSASRLVLRRTWQPMDPDAAAYITAVEAADTAAGSPGGLEERTKIAIDNFVLGCKADGIWTAIKASCILAGARTLSGALVPLAGTAPNRFGTEAGWNYNRKTGLQGNGTDNYLNSNRNNNADPQNSKHLSVYPTAASSASSNARTYIGMAFTASGASWLHGAGSTNNLSVRANTNTSIFDLPSSSSLTGFIGISRSISSQVVYRYSGSSTTASNTSSSPGNEILKVFTGVTGASYSNACLAFYSIGEALDLALLDTRVTDLINAFATAIP